MTGRRARMLALYPLWRYRTTGIQSRLAATRDYQPSLRSPWLAAVESCAGAKLLELWMLIAPTLH